MNPYKWLWGRIGGRPWTYIIRDIYHCGEWLMITILILIGILMGKYLSWFIVWLVLGIFTVGYIGGHCFWGTKYIQGQEGENNGGNTDKRG
jgi:hypothetical protein